MSQSHYIFEVLKLQFIALSSPYQRCYRKTYPHPTVLPWRPSPSPRCCHSNPAVPITVQLSTSQSEESSDAGHYVGNVIESTGVGLFIAAVEFGHLSCEAHQRSESTEQGVQQNRQTALHRNLTLVIHTHTRHHRLACYHFNLMKR